MSTQLRLASLVVKRVVEKLKRDRESITNGLLGQDGRVGKSFPLERRFWLKVIRGAPDECWPWIGASNEQGYGNIIIEGHRGGSIEAHRLSWIIHNGPIYADGSYHGPCVCHNCPSGDNPSCVNPAHLFLGTQQQNIHDMDAKGGRGERAQMTPEKVIEVLKSNEATNALAKRYGVEYNVVYAIRKRKSWKWVEA